MVRWEEGSRRGCKDHLGHGPRFFPAVNDYASLDRGPSQTLVKTSPRPPANRQQTHCLCIVACPPIRIPPPFLFLSLFFSLFASWLASPFNLRGTAMDLSRSHMNSCYVEHRHIPFKLLSKNNYYCPHKIYVGRNFYERFINKSLFKPFMSDLVNCNTRLCKDEILIMTFCKRMKNLRHKILLLQRALKLIDCIQFWNESAKTVQCYALLHIHCL